jgi:hypothetical protein
MTRPPEYDQVARWIRAISGDPGLLDDIRAGYPGSGQVLGEEFVEQQRQLLANEARSALMRIDLEDKSLDEVAEAYHQDQVAEYARRQRALQERIRELTDGDFEVPSRCAYQAARDGTDLELVIEEHRQNELSDARLDLGLLPGRYQVTEGEVETYWAVQHLAAARHLVNEHQAEPDRVTRDAPTQDQLQGIHDAAHRYPDAPWGQVVMQARADAWWAERDRHYRNRPEVLGEIERLRAEAGQWRAAQDAYLESLERRIEAGSPGAQQELNEAMTRQALETDPPEPSAKEDPDEWGAFFREVLGRDMPHNAAYEAENYRIDAAAPPDVFGLAAEYYEAHDPVGFDYDELAAERQGLSLGQLYAQRYRELHASDGAPGTAVTGPQAAQLAGTSFPAPVQSGPPSRGGDEASRSAPRPGPRATRGKGW